MENSTLQLDASGRLAVGNFMTDVPLLLIESSHAESLRQRFLARPVARTGNDKPGPANVARLPNAQATGGYGYAVDSNGIAVIQIKGMITPEAYAWYDDQETISDWVVRDLAAMINDPSVRGALFVIKSPGGYVIGSFEMADAIARFAAAKPTATSAEGYCCSAAFLQACQTAHITAYRTAIVGSIGTRSAVYDYSAFFAKFGVKAIPIDSGGMKSAGLPGTEITQDQIDYFRSTVLALQKEFTAEVAKGRGMSIEQAEAMADGRVYVATDAKSKGLIDAVGSQTEAYAALLNPTKKVAAVIATAATSTQSQIQQTTAEAAAAGEPGASAPGTAATGAEAPLQKETTMSQNTTAAPGNPPATSQSNSTGSASAEPKPASIAELQAAFSNDPAFALDCAGKALTLLEAKAAYADVLQKKNAELTQKNTELQAASSTQSQTQTGKRTGVKAIESAAAEGSSSAGGDGSATAELEQLATERMKLSPGLQRHDANAKILAEDQGLRERYVAEQNAARKDRIENRSRSASR